MTMTRTLALVLLAVPAIAVPRAITYQARVEGIAAAGAVDVDFALWDAETGGTRLFAETQTVDLWDGVITARIGDATAGGLPDAFGGDAWLEVTVHDGSTAVTLPRQRFTSVAYAYRAASAESVRWTDVTGVPASIADGALSGQSCPPGAAVVGVSAAGTLVCEADADATVGAGPGLTLDGTTLSADFTSIAAAGHVHPLATGATDVTAGAADINQALAGISASVTATALNTLTGGPASDASALHTHAGQAVAGAVCYTNYGGSTCADGFTAAYTGTLLLPIGGYWGSSAINIADVVCFSAAPSGHSYDVSTGAPYFGMMLPIASAPAPCAVCCR